MKTVYKYQFLSIENNTLIIKDIFAKSKKDVKDYAKLNNIKILGSIYKKVQLCK
jgi:hypothetical protein